MLQPDQVSILAWLRHQFFVSSLLGDPSKFHHDNSVGSANRREPVGDNEQGAIAAKRIYGVLNRLFASSALVASSNTRIAGFFSSARAIVMR